MPRRRLVAGSVCILALAVCGLTLAQQPPASNVPPPAVIPDPNGVGSFGALPTPMIATPVERPAPVQAKPTEPSIEQLLDVVEAIRAQKAELERKEQALMKTLHEKADRLTARIMKLTPPPAAEKVQVDGPLPRNIQAGNEKN